jgi:hypothetical protein
MSAVVEHVGIRASSGGEGVREFRQAVESTAVVDRPGEPTDDPAVPRQP